MPDLLQHLLVLLAVTLSAGFVAWQLVRTFAGRGNAGSCCAKGCGSAAAPRSTPPRTVVVPLSSLRRRRGISD